MRNTSAVADLLIKHSENYPLLNRAEEKELAIKASKGDTEAKETLFYSNVKFVLKMANKYSYYVNHRIDMDDLVQEASLGLRDAIEKFDYRKNYRLITYAVWWIKAYMGTLAMKNAHEVGMVHTTSGDRELFWRQQSLKSIMNIRDPDQREKARQDLLDTCKAAKRANILRAEIRLCRPTLRLDAKCKRVLESTGATSEWHELIGDECKDISAVEAAQIRHRIIKAFNTCDTLDDREKYIICRRFFDDPAATLQELGEEYKISRERVRQIQNIALKKLKQHFTALRCTPEEMVI